MCKTRLIMRLRDAKSAFLVGLLFFSRISRAVLHQIVIWLSKSLDACSRLSNEVPHKHLRNTLRKKKDDFFLRHNRENKHPATFSIRAVFGYIGTGPFSDVFHTDSLLLLLFP